MRAEYLCHSWTRWHGPWMLDSSEKMESRTFKKATRTTSLKPRYELNGLTVRMPPMSLGWRGGGGGYAVLFRRFDHRARQQIFFFKKKVFSFLVLSFEFLVFSF